MPASYDEYEAFVVVCQDEDTARRTHPDGRSILDPTTMTWVDKNTLQSDADALWHPPHHDLWLNIGELKDLKITHLGMANQDGKEGVVMSHYIHS